MRDASNVPRPSDLSGTGVCVWPPAVYENGKWGSLNDQTIYSPFIFTNYSRLSLGYLVSVCLILSVNSRSRDGRVCVCACVCVCVCVCVSVSVRVYVCLYL